MAASTVQLGHVEFFHELLPPCGNHRLEDPVRNPFFRLQDADSMSKHEIAERLVSNPLLSLPSQLTHRLDRGDT